MRLRPEHKQYHMVTNPLVSGAEELTTEQIEEVVKAFNDDPSPETRQAAIMAFGSSIRHIVGRYIGTYRSLKSIEDDMVTEAFMVVMAAVDNGISHEDCHRVISNRILKRLTNYVNKFRTATAPVINTQWKRLKEGKDVLYAVPLDMDVHDQPSVDESFEEFEFLSSLIESDLSPLEQQVLEPENWGLPAEELAAKLGVHRATIYRAIDSLITKSKEIIYAD